jgi:hypothetical protein
MFDAIDVHRALGIVSDGSEPARYDLWHRLAGKGVHTR